MILLLELMGASIMVNGVVIISPDAEVSCYNIEKGGYHSEALKKYLVNKELTYNGYQDDGGYVLALYLTSINHLVISVENCRRCYYLGDSVTASQEKWYKANRRRLKRFPCAIVNNNAGEIEFYDDYNVDYGYCFSKLDEIISEKKVIRDIGINNSKV